MSIVKTDQTAEKLITEMPLYKKGPYLCFDMDILDVKYVAMLDTGCDVSVTCVKFKGVEFNGYAVLEGFYSRHRVRTTKKPFKLDDWVFDTMLLVKPSLRPFSQGIHLILGLSFLEHQNLVINFKQMVLQGKW